MTSSSENLFANITAAPASADTDAAAEVQTDTADVTQLDMLKNRAKLMGITFSNNIGLDALRAKIDEKLSNEAKQQAPETVEQPVTAAVTEVAGNQPAEEPVKTVSLRQRIYNEQMKLVRLRITNLDPKKKDLPGEILTVANEFLGTVRKFVPFGEATDNGFHVPFCLYTMMKEREFVSIRTKRDKRTGVEIVEHQMVREFALEVMEPLTEIELNRLAAAQSAADGAV